MDIPAVIQQAHGGPTQLVGRQEIFRGVITHITEVCIGVPFHQSEKRLWSGFGEAGLFRNKQMLSINKGIQTQGFDLVPLRQGTTVGDDAEHTALVQLL